MNIYEVYYLNQYCRVFYFRDGALDYIESEVDADPRVNFGDFEILDKSDFPD